MERKPIIEVRDLVAGYGGPVVLQGISFDVYPGEIMVVIGGSGCGKSTLLRNMVGLRRPVSGSISYWGKDITGMDEDELAHLLHRVGLSFQEGALFNSMTVGENVALPIDEYGDMDKELIPVLVRMKLSLVGLGDCGYMMPEELSGGMKKRVGFARAIAVDPKIVYFDEPSAGLDKHTYKRIFDYLVKVSLSGRSMIILSSEMPEETIPNTKFYRLESGTLV